MLKRNKGFTPRIPDRFAVLAALTLTFTAGAGLVADGLDNDGLLTGAAGESEPAALSTQADTHDPTSDDAAAQRGLASRLLLFRRS